MTNDYGSNAPLSYNKYLRVPDLIGLQDCLSDPQHHDELLFITIHQAYELWFKQILHEIDAAISLMNEDRLAAAARAMRRVVEIEKLLVTQIHILETMTPISFLGFRDQLNPASGFQSMQFREIEFASGLKHENMLNEFRADEFAYGRLQKRFDDAIFGRRVFCGAAKARLDAPAIDNSIDEQERKASLRETHPGGAGDTHSFRGALRRVSTRRSFAGARRILLSLALASHQDGRTHGGHQARHRRFGRCRLLADHARQEVFP